MVFEACNKQKLGVRVLSMVGGIVFFPYFSFAQTGVAEIQAECGEYVVQLVGEQYVKQGIEYRYTVESTLPIANVWSIEHEIRHANELQTTFAEGDFSYTFQDLTEYSVKSIIRTLDGCVYATQQEINVYDRLFTYIWTDAEEFSFVRSSFQETGLLLYYIPIEENTLFNDEELLQTMLRERNFIQHANILFFEGQLLNNFLSIVPTLQQFVTLDFSDTHVYVLATINTSAFRRLFATYRELAGITQIGVLPKQYIWSLLNLLIVDKDPLTLDILKIYETTVEKPRQRSVVSYLVDYLLYNGLPLSFLIMLLLLPVLVVVAAFFRQVVWFSVYGVFNPLFLAFSLYLIGIELTIFFFVISFLATMVVNLITKRIFLLYSAKIALVVVVYTLLLLASLTIAQKYQVPYFPSTLFSNLSILFPIVFLAMVAYSIFKDKTAFFSKTLLKGLLQFIIVSTLMYVVLRWVWLQNLLLWYPELLLFFLIGTIVIGRFTGLQLTEYVRFMPLILRSTGSKEDDEEE